MQGIVDAARRQEAQQRRVENSEGDHHIASPSPNSSVYEEMLNDCRRKAGEATLHHLRRLCQRKGSSVSSSGKGGELDEDGLGDEETIIVSYHAALLGRADGAANIYGG